MGVHERHGNAAAPGREQGALRHEFGPVAKVGRRGRRRRGSWCLRDLVERNLPGLSVAVGVGGDIVWAEGFGFADLENQVAVTPDTRFRIGTASNALTSAAVGLLMEKGRLNLDEEIQTYVPEFPKKEWPVTLRQLMGQVAGVANDGGDEGPLFGQHCERPVDALEFFAETHCGSSRVRSTGIRATAGSC